MDLKQILSLQLTSQITQNIASRDTIKYALLSYIGFQLVDVAVSNLNIFSLFFKEYIQNAIQTRVKKIRTKSSDKPFTAHIEFKRDYSNTDEQQTYIDAIIYHISQLNSVVKLQRRKIYLVNSLQEFEITADIKGRVRHILEREQQINEVIFEIYSYTLPLNKLREWADNLYEIYKMEVQTGFGRYKYYFNHKTTDITFHTEHIIFDMNKFDTNKSLDNIFGKHIEQVRSRVKMFQNDKDWYESQGIPYTLGLLLHGKPGCGKTSLIKAIAKDTKRHILNIKLTSKVTLTELRNLFYSEKIKVSTDINSPPRYITIPIDQRIYVMEDVDCLTDLLNSRNGKQTEEKLTDEDLEQIKLLGKQRWKELKQLNTDGVTLSDILNIIDGVLETPGRILILTSNYPEKLDSALLRPGRMDLIIDFKECDVYQLQKMFQHFYKEQLASCDFDYAILDNKFTPAFVQEIFLRHFNDPQAAFDNLVSSRLPENMNNTVNDETAKKVTIIDDEQAQDVTNIADTMMDDGDDEVQRFTNIADAMMDDEVQKVTNIDDIMSDNEFNAVINQAQDPADERLLEYRQEESLAFSEPNLYTPTSTLRPHRNSMYKLLQDYPENEKIVNSKIIL